MKTVMILEENDIVSPNDWVRPLHFSEQSHSGYVPIESTSVYSGKPKNNIRWVRFSQIFGEYWFGKTLGEINESFKNMKVGTNHLIRYEVLRGDIPKEHIWD